MPTATPPLDSAQRKGSPVPSPLPIGQQMRDLRTGAVFTKMVEDGQLSEWWALDYLGRRVTVPYMSSPSMVMLSDAQAHRYEAVQLLPLQRLFSVKNGTTQHVDEVVAISFDDAKRVFCEKHHGADVDKLVATDLAALEEATRERVAAP